MRIDISPRSSPALLLLRYFALMTDGAPYRVRVTAGEERIDESLIVLQESRLVRGLVPAGCSEVIVEVLPGDEDSASTAGRVRVGVCQLLAIE